MSDVDSTIGDPPPPHAPALACRTADELRQAVRTVLGDVGRIVAPDGIDEVRSVELNGYPQRIHLRGQSRHAPILLFLHGGPLSPVSDFAWAYQRPWEDFFLVVNWDQRGAGRSWGDEESGKRFADTFHRRQFIADAIVLIERLNAEFGRDKLVLVGQSWGTVMALEIAKARPDLLHVAVLQGLAVNWLASPERIRLRYLAEAERRGDATEAARLRDVGPIPAADDPALLEWPAKFGVPMPGRNTWHNIEGEGDGWSRRIDMLRFISPDVSPDDYAEDVRRMAREENWKPRYDRAVTSVAPWDAPTDVGYRFEVPILVMQGDHDWQTSTELARDYYERIEAPWKKWVSFPHAAHALNIEQPGLSVVTLVNDVLPATRGEVPTGVERPGS